MHHGTSASRAVGSWRSSIAGYNVSSSARVRRERKSCPAEGARPNLKARLTDLRVKAGRVAA